LVESHGQQADLALAVETAAEVATLKMGRPVLFSETQSEPVEVLDGRGGKFDLSQGLRADQVIDNPISLLYSNRTLELLRRLF
jgi:hypothetical protein